MSDFASLRLYFHTLALYFSWLSAIEIRHLSVIAISVYMWKKEDLETQTRTNHKRGELYLLTSECPSIFITFLFPFLEKGSLVKELDPCCDLWTLVGLVLILLIKMSPKKPKTEVYFQWCLILVLGSSHPASFSLAWSLGL